MKTAPPMELEPTGDRIMIRKLEGLDKTEGGIVIPEDSEEHHNARLYEVLAVGPGRRNEAGELLPLPFVAGDLLLLSGRVQGHGVVTIGGDEIGFIQEHEIVAKVKLRADLLERTRPGKFRRESILQLAKPH